MSWSARLLVGLVLIIAGAAGATWGLARSERVARFLGVVTSAPSQPVMPQRAIAPQQQPVPTVARPVGEAKLADFDARLARVENATLRAEGFAGRADALVVAFAARRAIERGVALGYLEPLLIDRFGAQQQAAVGTVIRAAHSPVRLSELISEYEALGPELRRGGPQDSWWSGFKRGMGSLVEIRRADRPAENPDARHARALQRLSAGDVDQALAETMRLPGAASAGSWIAKARRYVAARRALDQIESAALLGNNAQR